MATTHPYVSSTGALVTVLDHLRKSFPTVLNADTLKRLGFFPNNESYFLNLLRFLDLTNEDGARTDKARMVFSQHENEAFHKEFSSLINDAYGELFNLHGENAWTLADDKLITFFRQTDQSGQRVGEYQARTFRTLSAYAGHTEPTTSAKPAGSVRTVKKNAPSKAKSVAAQAVSLPSTPASIPSPIGDNSSRNIGLTVRIEINLPSTGDQDTYDKIFKSIRENLLNG